MEEPLKLFLLIWINTRFAQTNGLILAALNEENARKLAYHRCTPEYKKYRDGHEDIPGVWLDPNETSCEAIGISFIEEERIILVDFYEL